MDAQSTFSSITSSILSRAASSIVSRSDRWTFSTIPSFVPDIGMMSGKAFLAIGNAQIRLLKRLWVRYRRRMINMHFPHDEDYTADGVADMYTDLIDFSRRNTHNDKTRLWALNLLRAQIHGAPIRLVHHLHEAPFMVSVPVLYDILQDDWSFCNHGHHDSTHSSLSSYILDPLLAQLVAEAERFPQQSEAQSPILRLMLSSLVINTTNDEALCATWTRKLIALGETMDRSSQFQGHYIGCRVVFDTCHPSLAIRNKLCKHALRVLHDLVAPGSPGFILLNTAGWPWTVIGAPIQALNDFARCLLSQGLLPQAETLNRALMETYARHLGANHQFTLDATLILARIVCLRRRYEEAESLFRRALEGFRQTIDFVNYARLPLLGSFSKVRLDSTDIPGSIPAVVGHHRTLTALSNLADTIMRQGRFDEAELMYHRALNGSEPTFGETHQHTLRIVFGLAEIYRQQKRSSESEEHYSRVLRGYERLYGPDSPHILGTLHGLGIVLRMDGRVVEAEQLYRRALQLHERFSDGSTFTANPNGQLWIIAGLNDCLNRQGRDEEAKCVVQLTNIPGSPDTACPVGSACASASISTAGKRQVDDSPIKLDTSPKFEETDSSVLVYEILAM